MHGKMIYSSHKISPFYVDEFSSIDQAIQRLKELIAVPVQVSFRWIYEIIFLNLVYAFSEIKAWERNNL